MSFLRNIWYVAAWSDEVPAGELLAREILAEKVVLFRDSAGRAVALHDRCPHRSAPLHAGKLNDGVVECGYHGLQFDKTGACVFNPHGQGIIPPNASVQSYPLEERHSALWIWMGKPALADPATIPDFSMVVNNHTTIVRGYLSPRAHYELMSDNLLDLGHTAFLHPNSLGSEAIVRSERKTRRDGDRVVYQLWAPDGDAPLSTQARAPQFQGKKVDHWLESTWHAPGLIHQLTGTALAGTNRANAEELNGLHWLTPETHTSTHYFHALSRSSRRDDPEFDEMIRQGARQAFTQEDFPMIEAIQEELGGADYLELNPVILSTDTGGLMARRILRQMLKREAQGLPVTSTVAAPVVSLA